MLKAGVLGAGHLGKIHLKLLQQSEKYDLVGFYDSNSAASEAIEKLIDPIFQPPLEQFEKALGFRNGLPPDHANAVKEAVNSLEAVLQIVANKPSPSVNQHIQNSNSRVWLRFFQDEFSEN